MIYIFETEILENKTLEISLQKIYGLGKSNIHLLIKQLGFSKNLKIITMSSDQVSKLIKLIEISDLKLSSDLKKIQAFALKNLVEIKSIKGLRRIKGYPIRGQRTHTNSKTAKRQKRFKN